MKHKILKTTFIFIFVFSFTCFSSVLVNAQPGMIQKTPADYAHAYDRQLPKERQTLEEKALSKRIRQGAFARQLIKVLELESELPLTATEVDAIQLLRSYGIAPLKGWDRYAPLTEDDYAVVIGKSIGKEYLVHEKAQQVCDEIVKLLNVEWQLQYVQNGRYPMLEKMIRDESVFSGTQPRCPYGIAYKIGGGYKPHILSHRHLIETPLRDYLFQERDYFKSALEKRRRGRRR